MNRVPHLPLAGMLLVLIAGAGCDRSAGVREHAGGGLVLTQIPRSDRAPTGAVDVLDERYPPGSRVVHIPDPAQTESVTVLSAGLHAAGGPVLGPDGRTLLFVGREDAAASWQVWSAQITGGPPRKVTSVEGGAMDPAWLPDGVIVFSAPVPHRRGLTNHRVPALHSVGATGGPVQRLTFDHAPATDPTVLVDGRILYVSGAASEDGAAPSPRPRSLFTINSDGTEVAGFAGQHDGGEGPRRPRQTPDGRVVFLAGGAGPCGLEGRVEQVLMSQPYRSRSVVFPLVHELCRSVEPGPQGSMLLALRHGGPAGSYGIYRMDPGVGTLGTPLFDDPGWDDVDAIHAAVVSRPMGRLSSVDPSSGSGLVLCLNARWTDGRGPGAGAEPTAIRVYRHPEAGSTTLLGEAPLQDDGSFLVEVPADAALSFEWVTEGGGAPRRCPPRVWVRPGENRACIGCHEPHNSAPENVRPLAVAKRAVRLLGPSPAGVQVSSTP